MKKEGIGAVLQAQMEKQGITATQLAEATRIPKQTIYSMLKKTTFQVDILNLKKVMDYLEIDILIFFSFDLKINDNKKAPYILIPSPVSQDKEERAILSDYRKLNRSGKKKTQEYLGDLASHPGYTTISSYEAIMKRTSDESPLLSDHKIRAPEDYLLYYHLCIRMLGTEIIRLADMYLNQELSMFQFKDIIFSWENNTPELLYENQDEKILSKELLGYIGEDRAKLINLYLKCKRKN